MILALDTTAEFGSIALVDAAGGALDEVLIHAPDGFGHVLFTQIETTLARRGLSLAAIDCFAAASGPGSFTGVRIGLAAVKGLAHATGKKAVAVSNLRALATFGAADYRATLIDARRGEIYGAVYDRALRQVSPEVVMKFQDWIATLPKANVELIASNPAPFAPFLPGIPVIAAPRALAAAVGRIAASVEPSDPASIDANYVRRSDAEILWRGADS